jgi:hemoglobin
LSNLFRKKADPTQATINPTLYERLGGEPAVNTAVDIFYRKVIADARINYFFFGVNISEQAAKQKAFLSMAFGGPHEYTGRDMRRSHAKLVGMGMNDRHFDIVLDHLRSTLKQLDAPENLIQEVIDICESTREDVMNRSPTRAHPATPTRLEAMPQTQSPHPVLSVRESRPTENKPAHPAHPVQPSSNTVTSILSTRVVTLSPGTSIQDAAELFSREGFQSLPVVDETGKLMGVVTSADLIRHFNKR